MLRFKDIFNQKMWKMGIMSFNMKAVVVIGILMITVFMLALLCIILPSVVKVRVRDHSLLSFISRQLGLDS